MSKTPHGVQVLIIDDDKQFRKELLEEIESHSQGLDLGIQIADNFENCSFDHDLYVCAQHVDSQQSCIDQIKKIKDHEPEASVFVILEFNDYDFLKKLFKCGISGVIDKSHIDVSYLLDKARTIAETRVKIERMVQKLNALNSSE